MQLYVIRRPSAWKSMPDLEAAEEDAARDEEPRRAGGEGGLRLGRALGPA